MLEPPAGARARARDLQSPRAPERAQKRAGKIPAGRSPRRAVAYLCRGDRMYTLYPRYRGSRNASGKLSERGKSGARDDRVFSRAPRGRERLSRLMRFRARLYDNFLLRPAAPRRAGRDARHGIRSRTFAKL